jgi:hypothetical protein
MMNPGFGHGGVVTMDAGDKKTAGRLMQRMQEEKVEEGRKKRGGRRKEGRISWF